MALVAGNADSKSIVFKDPTTRAFLYSSSCERWKEKYGVRPINFSTWPLSIAPLPLERADNLVRRALQNADSRSRSAQHYCGRCIERQHRNTGGVHAKRFKAMKPKVAARAAAVNDNDDQRDVDVKIDFKEEDYTTEVTVTSVFPSVRSDVAVELLEGAKPYRWAARENPFFKQSLPLETVRSFLPNRSLASQLNELERDPNDVPSYHLLEHVEWNWTPELVAGLVNVLEITPSLDVNVLKKSVREAAASVAESSDDSKQLLRSNVQGLVDASPHKGLFTVYRYSLVRSIQSKFTSSWEQGGLDIDGGDFAAGWFEKDRKLFIRASKRIRYSAEAEAAFGASRLLNLIAPAVVSMLMRNLVYDSVIEALDKAGT